MPNHIPFIDGDISQANRVQAAWLNDVNNAVFGNGDALRGSALLQFIAAGSNSVVRDLQSKARENLTPQDKGAEVGGLVDAAIAFARTWAQIKETGGEIIIPPGNYLLNSEWLLDIDTALPHNYKISAHGATLFAGPAVTGHAIRVQGGFNNFGLTIEGLAFNHRNNTTVGGCIQLRGTNNCKIIACSVEHHNTKAGYSGIEIGPITPGVPDTSSFWTVVEGFTTRQRFGGDGTNAATGIRLLTSANATTIKDCSFASVVNAILLETDGVSTALQNSTRIVRNNFEEVTNAITLNTAAPATAMPTGLYVNMNRVENATTFFNITGAAVLNSNYPPVLRDNYLTVGNVVNFLVNPNNQYVFSDEPSLSGVGSRNIMGGPSNIQIIAEGTGKNVILSNLSGGSDWQVAHMVFGTHHFWSDVAGTGRLFAKATAPASAQDGSMVGNICGTATFAAATSLVVNIGVTMTAATYKVSLGSSANKTFWVTGKTTTQFTLNASTSSSDAIDWILTV